MNVTKTTTLHEDLRELLLAVSMGDATESEYAKLCSLIRESDDTCRYVVSMSHQLAALESRFDRSRNIEPSVIEPSVPSALEGSK